MEVIPLTWAFRIERKPNGEFDKFKARLAVRGDLKHDERETCAPVVKQVTVRTLLALALQMKSKARQTDFDDAFVQAELNEKERMCITLPVGVHHATHESKDAALKLLKSLCGMKEAHKLWFQNVTAGLMGMGFERSQRDQCPFMHKKKQRTLLLCTNDCLLFCETDKMFQEMTVTMHETFSLTEQDVRKDMLDYSGTQSTFKGTKVMARQDGLMKNIFKTTKWEELTGDKTPAREKPIGADSEGNQFKKNECMQVLCEC